MLIPIVLVLIIIYAIYKLTGHSNNNGHYNIGATVLLIF